VWYSLRSGRYLRVLSCSSDTSCIVKALDAETYITLDLGSIKRNIKHGLWRKDAPDMTKRLAELES
jgi:hypothetical protein